MDHTRPFARMPSKAEFRRRWLDAVERQLAEAAQYALAHDNADLVRDIDRARATAAALRAGLR